MMAGYTDVRYTTSVTRRRLHRVDSRVSVTQHPTHVVGYAASANLVLSTRLVLAGYTIMSLNGTGFTALDTLGRWVDYTASDT